MARAAILGFAAVLLAAAPLQACDPTHRVPAHSSAASLRDASAGGDLGPAAGGWSHLVSVESNGYNPDCNPWVTADGRTLFFITWDGLNGPVRPGFQGQWDIYEAHWDSASGSWGEAVNLGPPVNTAGAERRPSATATGDTLFFNRGPNVCVSIRSGGTWSAPVSLFGGSDPCIRSDAQQIYFVRNQDIWIADRGSTLYEWVNQRAVGPPVNSQYAEVRPFLSFDRTKLFWSDFGNPRPGGYGASDLWVSTWTGTAWGAPINVGPPVNTDRNACTPFLSRDGRRLYTASESFEGSRGDEDVWVAFLDSVPEPRTVAPVGGAWVACGELAGAWNVYDLAEGPDGALYATTSPAGVVYRSDDAGASWTALPALPGARIVYSLLAAGDGALYAGTYPLGDVFRSTDRGASWQPTANIPGATTVRALLATRDGRILAGVSPTGAVFATSNGGQSWTQLATLPGLLKNGVTCLLEASSGHLLAGGWGPLYRSTDGGTTWAAINSFPFPPSEARSIDSFYETRDSTLWATGWVHSHGGYVFRSTDTGATWDTTGTIRVGPVHAVRVYAMDEDAAEDLRIGFQPGPDSVASLSADGGATWVVEGALAGAHEVFCFLRTAGGTLYAGTTPNGDVFRWQNPTDAGLAATGAAPAALLLRPGAPNPTHSAVRLGFRIGRAGHAVLEVVDARGRKVRTLFDCHRPAGEGAFVWDGRDDAGRAVGSGIYFARLRAGGRTQTRKVAMIP